MQYTLEITNESGELLNQDSLIESASPIPIPVVGEHLMVSNARVTWQGGALQAFEVVKRSFHYAKETTDDATVQVTLACRAVPME